ncbi:HAD family hydrolase [Ammoniphilus sp. 3BR4]|uniref:HAD family hydrolase n=1 Tax=Ammoniphilus sp. 3BR4 TaxID=3158265 RepID=UPI003467BDD1
MGNIPFAAIFDMDGTLLKTEEVAVPAFKKTFEKLKEDGSFQDRMPTDKEITDVFGMTLEEIWNKLLPGKSEEIKKKADRMMLKYELEILKEGKTHLYPGVKENLQKLKEQNIPLFIASNGLDEYIKGVCDCFHITDWFEDLYSAGRFQTESKDDLVAKLLNDYGISQAVMVGDRKSDIQAGKANGLYTIGCAFGFSNQGELAEADVIIKDFSEIVEIIEKRLTSVKMG